VSVNTEVAVLSGVPRVDRFPFHAGGRFRAAVGGEHLAVEDDVGPAVSRDPSQGVVQVWRGRGEDAGGFVAV
jgi:hypothetical protein